MTPRLAVLRLRGLRRRRVAVALLALSLAAAWLPWLGCGSTRVATFNIENFPKSARRVEGAFDAIRALDAVAIGVQEITDPGAFSKAARDQLGERWRFVYAKRGPKQRCETEGCEPGTACPVFHRDVSDHCPVVAVLR